MGAAPEITLHAVPYSHPCLAVRAALDQKGLAFETVDMMPGSHADEIERIYGEGRRTVPGLLVDGEPVHGSATILARLDELVVEPPLYPEAIDDAVREAERWGDDELQSTTRRLIWGALHFRPEALGTFGGAGTLDPAGVDYAIKMLRAAWRYTGVTAAGLAADLERLPGQLDHVDALIAEGTCGGERPNAADLQLGSSIGLLLTIGDVRPLVAGRPAETLARRWFDWAYTAAVPAGAFPAGWVPDADAAPATVA